METLVIDVEWVAIFGCEKVLNKKYIYVRKNNSKVRLFQYERLPEAG